MAKLSNFGRVREVFTPFAPVVSSDLFAGRAMELMQTLAILGEPGRHVVLYGERGVGKTSLANVLSQFRTGTDSQEMTARINCATNDTYKSIWDKVARALGSSSPTEWGYDGPGPDDIRILLEQIDRPILIVLDEYDRFEDNEGISLMADTLKTLSDHRVESKLVLVGVADSIDQLLGEHQSIQRAIAEIHLPRMTSDDSEKIIEGGAGEIGIPIADKARDRIVRVSEGLPHYVHLLAQNAFESAVVNQDDEVLIDHVDDAIGDVVNKHSLRREYQLAIQSPRADNLFPHVLAACALAEKNPLGQFTPGSVREPLSKIRGKLVEIPAFSRHLSEFISDARGAVLKREGTARRFTYRFENPLLQPFAIIAAAKEGIIPESYREQIL